MVSPGLTLTAGLVSWGVETIFACLLLIRLFALRLQGVYRIFVVFLIAEILGFVFYVISKLIVGTDYRLWFLCSRPVYWFLYLAMVYALARVVMSTVPGVYGLSRKVLHLSTVIAALVGTAVFFADKAPKAHAALPSLILLSRSLERSFTLTALLLLLGVLGFVLYFPVQVPRNLAVFSGAYVVYFTVTTASLFASDFLPAGNSAVFLTRVTEIMSGLCYCWWLLTLSRAGEFQPVRVGHIWAPAEQEKLLTKLNAINEALLAGGSGVNVG